MSFANLTELANATKQKRFARKNTGGTTSTVLAAGVRVFLDPWAMPLADSWATGALPGAGAGALCDEDTAGGIPYEPASTGNLFLAKVEGLYQSGSTANGLFLFDRLWHNSGYVPTDGGAKSVNSLSLPSRAGSGVGCWAFLEIHVTLGAAIAVSMTYTNSSGTGSRTAVHGTLTTSFDDAYHTTPFALQYGDVGIQSIQSITWTNAGSASGRFGLVIAKPIAFISKPSVDPVYEGRGVNTIGPLEMGLPAIPAHACLWPLYESAAVSGSSFPNDLAELTIVEG